MKISPSKHSNQYNALTSQLSPDVSHTMEEESKSPKVQMNEKPKIVILWDLLKVRNNETLNVCSRLPAGKYGLSRSG